MGGDSDTWWKAVLNELGILANKIYNRVKATNTIEFIRKEEVPKGRTKFLCDYHPLKLEPYRFRLKMGGDRLECPVDASSPAAPLLESKLLFNSTISDARQGTRFMSCDLKDSFLETPMSRAEYI